MRKLVARLSVAMLALSLLASILPNRVTAAGYSVVIDGMTVAGTQGELRNGQLMVAVRPFAEAMGGAINWDASAQKTTIRYNGSEMALWLGSHVVFQDGKRLWAPVKPYLKNGRSMVPAWWVAVQLGGKPRMNGTSLIIQTRSGGGGSYQGSPKIEGQELMKASYYFPYAAGTYEPYYDTMGDPRFYDGRSFQHEGTDILAKKGTPIYAVTSGKIVRYGWNTLGGYRVTIQIDEFPQYTFYYAHMDRYAPGLYLGARVKAGQLLGYTGSTGEGLERTEGKFVPHLHFGIYGPNGAINPYRLLKYWEQHRP